jgi:hypothetical protein
MTAAALRNSENYKLTGCSPALVLGPRAFFGRQLKYCGYGSHLKAGKIIYVFCLHVGVVLILAPKILLPRALSRRRMPQSLLYVWRRPGTL